MCACRHMINVYVGICYEKERGRERLRDRKDGGGGRERRQKEERGGEEREDK